MRHASSPSCHSRPTSCPRSRPRRAWRRRSSGSRGHCRSSREPHLYSSKRHGFSGDRRYSEHIGQQTMHAQTAVDGKRVVVDLRDRRPDARVRAVAAPADEAPTALEIVDGYSRGPRRDHDACHHDRLGGDHCHGLIKIALPRVVSARSKTSTARDPPRRVDGAISRPNSEERGRSSWIDFFSLAQK